MIHQILDVFLYAHGVPFASINSSIKGHDKTILWNEFGITHGTIDTSVHSQLVQLTSNCQFGNMLRRVGTMSIDRVHKLKDHDDAGFHFLFKSTVTDTELPEYNDAEQKLKYVCTLSSKWGFLAGIIKQVVLDRKKKLLILVSSPMVHQILDVFLHALGIPFASINSSVKAHDRTILFQRFDDPLDDIMIMTVNVNLGSFSFDAQHGCHVSVLLEFPSWPSPRLFDLLIGRTWRIGQKEQPLFVIVTTLATYDQVLQGKFVRKAII
ncbi:hypothetical protein IWZ01DRAFT_569296 [Phyllosticta capitalensis]